MEGAFALLFLAAGLTDIGLNYCSIGCLGRRDVAPRLSFSGGNVIFQDEQLGQEIYLRYELDRSFGPFQPTVGVSFTDDGALWAGAGGIWTHHFFDERAFAQLHLMPGFYSQV